MSRRFDVPTCDEINFSVSPEINHPHYKTLIYFTPMDSKSDQLGRILSKHTDSVLCCAIDDKGTHAITGGVDDMGYVWNLQDCTIKFECNGHKDSVVSCGFSIKSTYAATADMKGLLQIWKTESGLRVFEYEVDDISFTLWHNKSDNVILAGTINGDIYMWNVNDPTAFKSFQSEGHSANVAKLLSDGIRLAVGYANGTLKLFDLKTNQQLICVNDRNCSEILSMDINPSETMIALGLSNNFSKLLLIPSGKVIGEIQCAFPGVSKKQQPMETNAESSEDSGDEEPAGDHCDDAVEVYEDDSIRDDNPLDDDDDVEDEDQNSHEDEMEQSEDGTESIETVAFSKCGTYLCTASVGGQVHIWDVATRITRYKIALEAGVTKSLWISKGHYLTAGLDGCLRVFDTNLTEVSCISVSKDPILDLCLTNDIVVAGSDDGNCLVYELKYLISTHGETS